jgi:hypothetical protein
MATYEYYKRQQGSIPNIKPGSNWFHIKIDFTLQGAAQNDIFKICEVKNHWIVKCGFFRATVDSGTASGALSVGTASAGTELSATHDISTATDTWIRFDTVDDDGPIALTADGYLWAQVIDAAAYAGNCDLMIEIIVAPGDEDRVDSLAEAN